MRQKIVYSIIVALGLLMMVAVIAQENLWGSNSKLSKKKGYLGISMKRLTSSLKKELDVKEGVFVTWVHEDSPADKAGIMEDDVIVEVDGKKITRPETLTRVIRNTKPGTEINVVLIRDGEKKSVKVKVGKVSRGYPRSFHHFGAPFVNVKSAPYIGIVLQELNDDLAEYFDIKADEGILILEVEEDTPAFEAGLKAGDVIIKFEDENVSTPVELKEILSEFEEGDEVTIELIRHKKKQSVKVVLEEDGDTECNIFIKKLPNLKRLEEDLHKKLDHRNYLHDDDSEETEIKVRKKIKNLSDTI